MDNSDRESEKETVMDFNLISESIDIHAQAA